MAEVGCQRQGTWHFRQQLLGHLGIAVCATQPWPCKVQMISTCAWTQVCQGCFLRELMKLQETDPWYQLALLEVNTALLHVIGIFHDAKGAVGAGRIRQTKCESTTLTDGSAVGMPLEYLHFLLCLTITLQQANHYIYVARKPHS